MLRKQLLSLVAYLFLWMGATAAQAAVFKVDVQATGGLLGPYDISVIVMGDFIADIDATDVGLTTISPPPFMPSGGLGFTFDESTQTFGLGGLTDGIGGVTNIGADFGISIRGFPDMPVVLDFLDGTGGGNIASPTVTRLSVSEVTVPAPSAALLLFSSIYALFRFGRHRQRTHVIRGQLT